MPAATKACSTEQAQATLQLCANKLKSRMRIWTEARNSSSSWTSHDFTAEGRQFNAWLESWESAFSTLLAQAMPSMREEDVERCRILKANHLGCSVQASLLANGDRESTERDALAILGLASAVLTRPSSSHSDVEPQQRPGVMSMAEPLEVVAGYSSSATLRSNASRLLSQHFKSIPPRHYAAHSPVSSAASSPASWGVTLLPSRTSSKGPYQVT